jgi:hypothetical protein
MLCGLSRSRDLCLTDAEKPRGVGRSNAPSDAKFELKEATESPAEWARNHRHGFSSDDCISQPLIPEGDTS